jgi:hypothetical protein
MPCYVHFLSSAAPPKALARIDSELPVPLFSITSWLRSYDFSFGAPLSPESHASRFLLQSLYLIEIK